MENQVGVVSLEEMDLLVKKVHLEAQECLGVLGPEVKQDQQAQQVLPTVNVTFWYIVQI